MERLSKCGSPFLLGIKLPVIPKCQQRRDILGEKNSNLRTWKCPWKEIRSEFERFWISLKLEERKTEKSCAVSPEEVRGLSLQI
ncbi:hypothetical protein TNCT_285361 [Trichonephila clavata]|uniref:Uncharacterized protein n=1 Tax=Trichonephila clavata TaxID=2740835 RepID=A0A8X6IR68_TRICU|nr:hypothetical protein TNCT_285361 [Trichonephila clavata]